MISKKDFDFLKTKRLVEETTNSEDGTPQVITHPELFEKLSKKYEELTKKDVEMLEFWIKKHKDDRKEKINHFIWNENEIILNKVFPIDYSNNLFFYGIFIPKTVDNEIKGKKIGKKQIFSPCLITSNKELLEISERLKEDYQINFENIPSILPRRWKLENIRKYIIGESEIIDPKELVDKISKQYEKYLYIRNSTWYKIHALWDLGSYLYQIFEAYPFFELRGIAGTGKTKAMVISSYISFNGGQIMANPSESTLFRETDEVRGTKYFDEAEKLWVFNKATKQYEGDTRTELINASYTKETKVPRQEKIGNKFITKWYSPYSPTMLGSINGLYGATETRAITRITTKSTNEDARGELEPSEDREEEVWSEIRDNCYRFALDNWTEIKSLYNNFPKDIGLKRRDYQIWKPLLTLSKFISEDLFNEVVEFAKELTERRTQDLIQEASFDYLCLEALKNTIESTNTNKIYVDAIKLNYCALKGIETTNDVYLNRNISNHLDKLGFKELRSRDKHASFFGVDSSTFNEIVSPICPDLTILSTSSTLSTPVREKEEKKNVDEVAIDVDSKNEKVVMVAIGGDDVDTYEKNTSRNEFLEALKLLSKDQELISLEEINQLPFNNIQTGLNKLKEQGFLFYPKEDFIQLIQ